MTLRVNEAMDRQDWQAAIKLRGPSFANNLKIYELLNAAEPPPNRKLRDLRVALMHIGASCCGMNATIRATARWLIAKGVRVFGIEDVCSDTLLDCVTTWNIFRAWTD